MQLEHSFHKHESVHMCDATGTTKHIHQELDKNCSFLHTPLNFNFTFETTNIQLQLPVHQYVVLSLITVNLSLQEIPYRLLRGPPFSFYS